MNFSENLQTLRKSKGISQEQLAERLDVSRQAVSKWETDGGYPEIEKIMQLCDIFGVTMDELLKGKVDKADIREKYDGHYNSFAKGVAVGVFLIIAGVGMSSLLAEMFNGGILGSLSTAALFAFLAAGIAILAIFGIKNGGFEREHPFIPDIYSPDERRRFNSKVFPYFIAGGLALIFVGVIFTVLFNFAGSNSLMLFFIAAAVGLFVYAGIMHSKFDVRQYNRDRDYEQGIKDTDPPEVVARKKRRGLVGKLCGAIMLTATAIYLLCGFIWGCWDPSWAVFPIGGILCAIVALVIGKDGDN